MTFNEKQCRIDIKDAIYFRVLTAKSSYDGTKNNFLKIIEQ